MKPYRTVYWDRDMGQSFEWFSNKQEAAKRLRELVAEAPSQGPCEVEMVDVPTGRYDLIDWLNRNLQTDNG